MSAEKHNKLYRKCRSRGMVIRHACEVGVYMPETSNVIDFINDGTRTSLVEPDPKSLEAIHRLFGGKKNVAVFPVAVFDHDGTIELVQRDASTFVSSLPSSPAMVNDHYTSKEEDRFTVECRTFDKIDDGTIDLLSVDIEGSEWYVIRALVSRPIVISVETHGKRYVNPFMDEIAGWMRENGYRVWYKNNTDTAFARRDTIEKTMSDVILLFFREIVIGLLRLKRILKDGVTKKPVP